MYHYQESGLRNVWLRNGYTTIDTPYGKATAIDDVAKLHEAIAVQLTMKPGRLSGADIRFLRKEMELAQTSLGAMLGVSAQTLALWEKGKAKITAPSDKFLRMVVQGHYRGHATVRKVIDMLNHLDHSQHEGRLVFEEEGRRWKMA